MQFDIKSKLSTPARSGKTIRSAGPGQTQKRPEPADFRRQALGKDLYVDRIVRLFLPVHGQVMGILVAVQTVRKFLVQAGTMGQTMTTLTLGNKAVDDMTGRTMQV